ncbi:hypothetical protein M3B41_02170 [Klebsiella quasipneumoniae]|uniref:tail fiber/spike domain-containing protein n=1 Tax=Klebsiella quasipneumoniae TaxID=1463165 RepID=UPI001C2B9B73|nr:hypothetical protein [Klebsiella quasipneumoniae]MBV0366476.1 hypothetical protein [Klebsiella quasipneumoniae]MDT9763187.1 hypothetical protein [Klebsiella quasipneumoniae]MDZ3148411.1 hypothetical protein [Klebsiella quasipneumoniae]MDZ3186773.1 hypothetical protein [Klebsiella quasipneumoniae]
MALTLLATNNAESTLASAISATDTSLIVSAGTGAEFPDAVAGESYFKLTITDAATGAQVEIVNVTARSGDIFTIERGAEGTTPRDWLANDLVANMMTAETINIVAESAQQATIAASQASESADIAESAADNAVTTLLSAIKQTITFQSGGELNSKLDRISDGTYLYYWTGLFPKVVPPESTVEGTGGEITGAWACDTSLPFRQNLGSSDGLKWIGKCKDLSTLRTIEPTISGQSIILERAVVGGPLLNVILTHNPDAADAVDDGYSRFVTAGGAVWDADISFGHNVFLAGYSDELNNLAQCVNLIISHKVAKVISRGFVAGGVGAKLVVPANPRADGVTTFTMTAAIKVPSFLALYFDAQGAVLDYSAFNTETALVVSNEFPGLTQDMMFKNNGPGWGSGTGANAGHNEGGIFANGALLKGGNTLSNLNFTTYPGLRVGNVTYPSGSYAHCSGARVFDLRVSGFAEGLRLGSVDTYIPWIRGCHFTFNNIGVATKTTMSGSTAQWANSGERMLLESCLIADNFSHALSRDDRGNFITLKDCNIDYNGGDVVFCGPENIGKTIISGGHVEGNAGGWINCPARTTTAGENNLKMTGGVQLYVNAEVNDAYGGVRPMAFATTIRTVLDMDDFEIFCRAPYVNSAYPAWKPYNPANLARVRMNYPNSGQTYRFLPSYDGAYGYRINDKLLFSGTENENVPTSRTGDFWCIKSGGASCVYGGAADADSDGVIPIKITLNSPTDTVQLLFSRQITPERGTQHIHGFCSIKAAAFAGALNVSAIARTIASVTRTVTAAPGPVTETENLYGVNQSISQDILTSLANPTISITKDDYMGTRPLPVQLIGGNYSYLGFLYTGGTGTFYVKLPVWANLDLHPTIGYQ